MNNFLDAVQILRDALKKAEYAIKGREHTGFITEALRLTESATSEGITDAPIAAGVVPEGASVLWALRDARGSAVYTHVNCATVEFNQPYIKTPTTVEALVFAAHPVAGMSVPGCAAVAKGVIGYKYRVLTDRHTTGTVRHDEFQVHGVWGRHSGWMISMEKPASAFVTDIIELVAAPASPAVATVELLPGEKYAGILLGEDGAPDQHIILLPGEAEKVNWNAAVKWAKKAGGELPTRREQRILFANVRAEFKRAWHWSGEQRAAFSGYAWNQDFLSGYQDFIHQSFEGRARAVRRVAVTAVAGDLSAWTVTHNGKSVRGDTLSESMMLARALRSDDEQSKAAQNLMTAIDAELAEHQAEQSAHDADVRDRALNEAERTFHPMLRHMISEGAAQDRIRALRSQPIPDEAASVPVVVAAEELPPLPEPAVESYQVDSVMRTYELKIYTADQMNDHYRKGWADASAALKGGA